MSIKSACQKQICSTQPRLKINLFAQKSCLFYSSTQIAHAGRHPFRPGPVLQAFHLLLSRVDESGPALHHDAVSDFVDELDRPQPAVLRVAWEGAGSFAYANTIKIRFKILKIYAETSIRAVYRLNKKSIQIHRR